MKSGSKITDSSTTNITRWETESAGENWDSAYAGAVGAIWIQGGTVVMEEESEITDVLGRAIYVDGGSVTVSGTISNITGNSNMKEGQSGISLHLRGEATATLTSTGKITDNSGGGSAVYVNASTFTMDNGSLISPNYSKVAGIAEVANSYVYMNGKITGINDSNALQLNTEGYLYCEIGSTGYIHDNIVGNGAIYMQTIGGELHIYGRISDNSTISNNTAGGLYMANNYGASTVTMYDGAVISGNSGDKGGGVVVSMGTFIMEGGTISDNVAFNGDGGGVLVRRGGTFIMKGGTITGNYASGVGGGLAFDASNYHTSYIPKAELNGGTISGNYQNATITVNSETSIRTASGGNSNDLAITSTGYGWMTAGIEGSYGDGRYLSISGNATIGNEGVYFATDSKTVTPSDYNVKLANASDDSITALTNASTGKGWGDPLATFWTQRDSASELTVGGIAVASNTSYNSALPVYVLVQETNENGTPAANAEVKVYATTVKDGEISFIIPSGNENGYAVALVQPTTDYGTVVIEGPDVITEDDSLAQYEVAYTTTYTMSDNLKSLVNLYLSSEQTSGTFQFTVELDSRLTADTNSYEFTSDLFEVASYNVTNDGSTIVVTCKIKDKVTSLPENVVMTLNGTAYLAQEDFEAGSSLYTTGNISVSVANQNIYIPANVAETQMVAAQEWSVTFESNGGSNVEGQTVKDGKTATEPTAPTRDGYTFAGWYADEALTEAYDFSTAVKSDMTLYAKWTKTSSESSTSGSSGSSNSSSSSNSGDDSTTTSSSVSTDVKTGDTANLFLWVILLLAALAGIGGMVIYGKKKKI
ncbi:MAG: InlB B-repeat-containing protein [Lachnospiraceae bacterium]|nr:InlB B-repeat-containing protein [Lachnospiraceae bacterium]